MIRIPAAQAGLIRPGLDRSLCMFCLPGTKAEPAGAALVPGIGEAVDLLLK